jgi:UDP:flavonoid glycosyltransferase YjiC (YdhE family)
MVCLPHGRDQGDNAARVVACGAGLRLSRRSTTTTIRSGVQRVLGEPAFGQSARRMAELIADELQVTCAAAEVEAMLAATPAGTTGDRAAPS